MYELNFNLYIIKIKLIVKNLYCDCFSSLTNKNLVYKFYNRNLCINFFFDCLIYDLFLYSSNRFLTVPQTFQLQS